jgi:hypothetical protein
LDDYDKYEKKKAQMQKMMTDYKSGKTQDMFMEMMMQEKEEYKEG